MPNWPEVERKNFMMYDVSKTAGVPVSPFFETAEALCYWLAKRKVSWGKVWTPAHEEWLEIAERGANEDDHWYDRQIMIRAATSALLIGENGKAEEIMRQFPHQA